MLLYQIIILALIQGLTEFLPISSSAHLILPSQLLGWPDQGLAFDLAVHLGTLAAVLIYLRTEIIAMILGCVSSLKSRTINSDSRLALLVVLATLPAVVVGFFVKDFVETQLRSILVIAITSIFFGLVLGFYDKVGKKQKVIMNLSGKESLLIGLAQVLAFVPGTSRSGITITAALALGFDRKSSLRFSFLLSIPITVAAALLCFLDLIASEHSDQIWQEMFLAIVVAGLSAYACMGLFTRLVDRTGMMPFVIYRILLGILLLYLYFYVV